jgi:multiple sugar transport system permease protein
MLMPLPVVLVPQFVMAGFLGIQESALAVVLPAVFSPFGVFLLRQFLKSMPLEYVDAAKIDGAGHLVTLVAIAVPMLKPAIAALAILVFVDYWNVVEQAIVFITDTRRLPLSVSLSTINADIVFAASCFYMLPALLVFLYGQEHLVEGIQLSGMK